MFRKTVNWLKDIHPNVRVTVRRTRLPKEYIGYCEKVGRKRFAIKISNTLPEEAAIHILLHEWAHIVAWNDKYDHGREWAIAFSRIYREWERWGESP